jgi:putative multiple sugar transport system permease protein
MLLCILTGNVDLSVGSVAAFISALLGVMIVLNGMPVVPAIIIALVIGGLIGAFHGFWIAYVGLPPFIATLGGMMLFRGLTLGVLQGKTLGPYPTSFQIVTSGFLPYPMGSVGFHVTTLLVGIICMAIYSYMQISKYRKQKTYETKTGGFIPFILSLVFVNLGLFLLSYLLASYQGIPNVMVLLVILILVYNFITSRTTMGRHIYAFGGNRLAAQLSGIKTKRVFFWVYVNMGVLAALAGIVYAARLNASSPRAGTGFELDTIAACFIGGASASGGIGTIPGAIIGALVMGIMNNGMSIMGLGVDWQQAIKGLVVILAVAFDVTSKNRGR